MSTTSIFVLGVLVLQLVPPVPLIVILGAAIVSLNVQLKRGKDVWPLARFVRLKLAHITR